MMLTGQHLIGIHRKIREVLLLGAARDLHSIVMLNHRSKEHLMSEYEHIYELLSQKEMILQQSRRMYDALVNTIRLCLQSPTEISPEEISVDARLMDESLTRLIRLQAASEAMDLLIAGRPQLAEQDVLAQKYRRRVGEWLRDISMAEFVDSPTVVSDVTLNGLAKAFSAFEAAESQFVSLARFALLAETSATTETS